MSAQKTENQEESKTTMSHSTEAFVLFWVVRYFNGEATFSEVLKSAITRNVYSIQQAMEFLQPHIIKADEFVGEELTPEIIVSWMAQEVSPGANVCDLVVNDIQRAAIYMRISRLEESHEADPRS